MKMNISGQRQFSGKKVAVLGLGIEGESVCRFLRKQNAQVWGFDQKDHKELGEAYQRLAKIGVNLSLGKDLGRQDLVKFDFIFRSPGVKPDILSLLEARKRGVKITSETGLFFDLCPAKIIGVTGTKGKGTTSTLIYRIITRSGKKAYLAGNIGLAKLDLLPRLDRQSWVILELSSFQLLDLQKSPHLAVVLMVTKEHLNYHKSLEEYFEAKANLVRFQKKRDFAVINADYPNSLKIARFTKARLFYTSVKKAVEGVYVDKKGRIVVEIGPKVIHLGKVKKLNMLGRHNWENICAAVAASFLAGASIKVIKSEIFSYTGLALRLEKVAKIKKVEFYNDSASTTPESTSVAVQAFEKPLVLIAGGISKGVGFEPLLPAIKNPQLKAVVLIGKAKDEINKFLVKANFKGKIVTDLKNLDEAVEKAFDLAKPDGVVLFSPGCASFDMFANYVQRGHKFNETIKKLSQKPGNNL